MKSLLRFLLEGVESSCNPTERLPEVRISIPNIVPLVMCGLLVREKEPFFLIFPL